MDSQLIDGCDAAAEEPREAPAPGWGGGQDPGGVMVLSHERDSG